MKLVVTVTPSETLFAPILLRGPVDKTFALASRHGYDGIEIHLRNPRDLDPDKTMDLSARYNLPITAVGTGMAARMDGLTFSNPDAGVRRNAVACMKEFIALAQRLNANVIIGSFNGNLGNDAGVAKRRRGYHMSCLKECGKTAEDLGVTLLLEPCNRYECDWFITTEDALEVIEQAGSKNVKYLADTFHMNIEEAHLDKSFRRAGDKLGYVHLVDSNRRCPGQGHLAVRQVLQTLIDIKYVGCLSFECLPLPDPENASLNAVAYVRDTLRLLECSREQS